MRRLSLCCEGAGISKDAVEPKEQKIVREQQTEPATKSWDASVFPPKRKSVKKMVCNCFIHCFCGKCFKANKVLPPTPTASSFNSASNCSCTPPQYLYAAGNYGNKAKGAL